MSRKLSVIIPTYKRTESLKRLILSLKNQTIIADLELIVIDQNKEGFLESEIQISKIPNLRTIQQTKPNASLARNTGAMKSSHDIVLFIDDDLVPDPDFCEKGLAIFEKNSFIECFVPVVSSSVDFNFNYNQIRRKVIKKVNDDLIQISDYISAAVFITRQAFVKSGGFDVDLFEFAKTAEDQEYFLRFSFKDLKLYLVKGLSIFHDENQQGGCELRSSEYWITREKCIRAWVYRYKIHRGGALRLRISDVYKLLRSVNLNREGIANGSSFFWRQLSIFRKALFDTNEFLKSRSLNYVDVRGINHFDR